MLVTLAREIDTQLMEATYTFTVECTIKLLKGMFFVQLLCVR